MTKSLRYVAVAAFMAAPLMTNAQTPNNAGRILTNIATVTGANFLQSTVEATVTVGTQLGANMRSEIDQATIDGTAITNTVRISNSGNVSATFEVTWVAGETNGIPGAGWSIATPDGATIVLAPGAVGTNNVVVTVPGGAPNGSARSYGLVVSNQAPQSANTILTNYVGDNGTAYGGTLGSHGDAATRSAATATGGTLVDDDAGYAGPAFAANDAWEITVSAAVVGLTKTATIDGVTGVGIAGLAIPGATLTYKLILTNTGAAAALGLQLVDPVPATVTYTAGTLKDAGNVSSTYAAAGGQSDATGDDTAAVSGGSVIFSPGGTADTGAADGTLAPATGYSGFYQVTIN